MSNTPLDRSDADVARWIVDQVQSNAVFYEATTSYLIRRQFGERFLYQKANGKWTISKRVLALFNELTDVDVVWERGQRCWRMRRLSDKPGRNQP